MLCTFIAFFSLGFPYVSLDFFEHARRHTLVETGVDVDLVAEPGCDRTKRFYQYANRLARLYFLRELNGIDAYLVFIYFLNDPHHDGPKTEREWRAAITVLHEALGLSGNLREKKVFDVFVDVGELL